MMNKKQIESIYRDLLFTKRELSCLPDTDEQLSFIRRYLPKNYDTHILDAGCGDGKYIRKLTEFGYKNIWGIDLFSFAPPGVNNYINASIEKIPLPDHSMDLVYSLSVIFYLDEPSKALKEFFRLLKPGGYLIVTVHTKYSLFTLDRILKRKFKLDSVKHLRGVRFYSSLEYKRMMKEAGFKIVEIDGYRLSYFFWPILRKFLKLIGISYYSKCLGQNKRNKFCSLLRSLFCYHAVLVGCKP